MPSTAWYFAYGSNMSRAQMRSRGGEIFDERVGRLENYELAFNKKARGGTATANIRPAPGQAILGILYKINEGAFRTLDRFEGAPEHYRRIEVTVLDSEGKSIPAQVFIAAKVDKGLRPAAHYLKTILDGAREHGLPEEYLKRIEEIAEGR